MGNWVSTRPRDGCDSCGLKCKLIPSLRPFFILLLSLYAILGCFKFFNFFEVTYPPVSYHYIEDQVIHLTLFSASIDENLYLLMTILFVLILLAINTAERESFWKTIPIILLGIGVILRLLDYSMLRDLILVLSGFVTLTLLLAFPPPILGLSRERITGGLILSTGGIFLAVELLSLFSLAFLPVDPLYLRRELPGKLIDLENQLFHVLSPSATALLTSMTLIAAFKLVYSTLKPGSEGGGSNVDVEGVEGRCRDAEKPEKRGRARLVAPALISAAVGFFLALYPFLLCNDPLEASGWTDLPHYVRMLEDIDARAGLEALSYTFSRYRDRGLSLLPMFVVWKATGLSPWIVVKFTPVFLVPLIVVSSHFFVSQATADGERAFLASLLTASSFHVVVGIGIGLISNMTALIPLYIFSGLLFRSLREGTVSSLLAALSASLVLLFTHVYTWGMLMGVLAFFTAILGARFLRGGSAAPFKISFSMLAAYALIGLVRDLSYGSTGLADEVLRVARRGVAPENILSYYRTVEGVLHTGDGIFENPVLLLTSLLAVLLLLFRDDEFSAYLLSWLGASSLPLLLGDRTICFRLLYNIPFQVLAVEALALVPRAKRRLRIRSRAFDGIFCLMMIAMNVNFALRCGFELSKRI